MNDLTERSLGRSSMCASDVKFVKFRDLKDDYRWRLSSASGRR